MRDEDGHKYRPKRAKGENAAVCIYLPGHPDITIDASLAAELHADLETAIIKAEEQMS